jgi:DNA repair protein RecN (Recombination protein N)
LIKKFEDEQKTYTDITVLDYDGKVNEVLRLIGGVSNDATALEHAKHLIDSAKQLKEKYKN